VRFHCNLLQKGNSHINWKVNKQSVDKDVQNTSADCLKDSMKQRKKKKKIYMFSAVRAVSVMHNINFWYHGNPLCNNL
jgi:hypothetical protein